MTTVAVLAEYRKLRAAHPRISAKVALSWARSNPESTHPGMTWSTGYAIGLLTGAGTVDGFDVRVGIDYDTDPQVDGTFTDVWESGAVQNPNWRPGSRLYRWYVGVTGTIDEHRTSLSGTGMSRHEAYTTAVGYLRAEARRAADPDLYTITATVSRAGVELGEAKVYGFDVPDDYAAARSQLIDAANDLIGEALHEARTALDKITATTHATYVLVVRHPDHSNAFTTDGDVHTIDMDLGSSFTGSPDDEDEAVEWAGNINGWLDPVPVTSPVYAATVEQMRVAVEDYDAALAVIDAYTSTREN